MRCITETEGTADSSAGSDAREDIKSRFARVLSEHGAALRRLAASYTDTKSDCDDLEQDIALAIWQALPGFRRECSERTFVFRIAHNRGIRHVSRRRLLVAVEPGELDVVDPSPNAEALCSSMQESNWLLGAVRSLPTIYRQILVLSLEGMDYSEISQVLGIGESNVGVRLNRARHLLKTLLEQSGRGRSG